MGTDSGKKERHLEAVASESDRTPRYDAAIRERWLKRIARDGHLFDFFQLVRLLERRRTPKTGSPLAASDLGEVVRFRPETSVVFPASDVKSVEWDGGDSDPVTVVLSFLGLYGFDSPLPAFFHREIAMGMKAARPLRDFLDIFNHRFYSFYYLSWKKYRTHLWVTDEATDSASRRCLAVGGIGTRGGLAGVPVESLRVAAFAGQLGRRVRNADGIRHLIEGCMPGYNVVIEENVPRWVNLTTRPRVGRRNGAAASLGATATIGERAFDISGKFRIILGPLGLRQFQDCLPGGDGARTLASLVRLYVTDFLEYDVVLRLKTSEVPATKLGDRDRRLGFSTWLRRPPGEFTSRIVNMEWTYLNRRI